jgi:hypothetical protein
VSKAEPIVIGGCARSGTTLLRVMLDSHPRIACGPESKTFTHPLPRERCQWLAQRFGLPPERVEALHDESGSQAEFIERLFTEYAGAQGKPRWAEKTPANIFRLDYLFEHFPRARFLHVIRDGRDVACSLRTHPRHKLVGGELVPANTWRPIDQCARRWVDAIEAGLPYRGRPGYTEVRYEELVTQPEPTLRRVLDWLGETWDDAVLRHSEVETGSRDTSKFPQNPEAAGALYGSAVGRWQRDLSSEDAATVEEIAGRHLVELGYAEDGSWAAGP